VIGTGFDTSFKNITVLLNKDTARIISVSTTRLQFETPVSAETGVITVLMDCDSIVLEGTYTVVPDSILSFSPHEAPYGYPDTIITNMRLYDTTGLMVKFGSIPAVIASVNDSMIVAIVPQGAIVAPISVIRTAQTIVSMSDFHPIPFSGCSVEFGNLSAMVNSYREWMNNSSSGSTNDTGATSFTRIIPDTAYEWQLPCHFSYKNGDTLVFKGVNNNNNLYYAYINIVFDTVQNIITYLSAKEADRVPIFNPMGSTGGYKESYSSIILTSIDYNGLNSVFMQGNVLSSHVQYYDYWINSTYSYEYERTYDYENSQITMLTQLPLTDSSYIRITLSP
jgi:hypothetical protein